MLVLNNAFRGIPFSKKLRQFWQWQNDAFNLIIIMFVFLKHSVINKLVAVIRKEASVKRIFEYFYQAEF